MPQVCTSLPLSVEVCTPSYGSAERIDFVEWDAGLKIDVQPVVVHHPCDDINAQRAACERDLTECEVTLEGTQREAATCGQSLEQSRAWAQSRVALLTRTQAELDRCLNEQSDPAGAWVLGALAVCGVVARWKR